MNKSKTLVVSLLAMWASVGCSSDLEGPGAEVDSDQSAEQSFEVTSGSCWPNPCAHAGSCRRVFGGHVCTCAPGWSGANCQTDINECTSVMPCQHGGKCTNTVGAYTCNCTGTGWSGANCQTDIDECATPNLCQHGGKCANTAGAYTCNCTGTGYSGANCQTDINECSPVIPCQNGGTCTNVVGSYSCTCAPGWGGQNCTVPL